MVRQLKKALIPPHALRNFEIKKNYAGDNFPKTIKNGEYVINLEEYD